MLRVYLLHFYRYELLLLLVLSAVLLFITIRFLGRARRGSYASNAAICVCPPNCLPTYGKLLLRRLFFSSSCTRDDYQTTAQRVRLQSTRQEQRARFGGRHLDDATRCPPFGNVCLLQLLLERRWWWSPWNHRRVFCFFFISSCRQFPLNCSNGSTNKG